MSKTQTRNNITSWLMGKGLNNKSQDPTKTVVDLNSNATIMQEALQGTLDLTGLLNYMAEPCNLLAPKMLEALQLLGMNESTTDISYISNHIDTITIMMAESQTHILEFKHGALQDGKLLAKATRGLM